MGGAGAAAGAGVAINSGEGGVASGAMPACTRGVAKDGEAGSNIAGAAGSGVTTELAGSATGIGATISGEKPGAGTAAADVKGTGKAVGIGAIGAATKTGV